MLLAAGGQVSWATDGEDTVEDPMAVLSPEQQRAAAKAIDKALAWLATQQKADGSFAAPDSGQPGITAFCLLAVLSRGHLPGHGPYGGHMDRGIEFVLACQKPNDVFIKNAPGPTHQYQQPSQTAVYNHALAALMLCEVYGMTGGETNGRIRQGIEGAIRYTLALQRRRKFRSIDRGGWRYYHPYRKTQVDSDMSVTSWQLMFLRSAKNAGFEIPSEAVDEAVEYVTRCGDNRFGGAFSYGIGHPSEEEVGHAMTGAGILSLAMAGRHNTQQARFAGNWILRRPYPRYNANAPGDDGGRYHYAVFYCTQATFQLGEIFWKTFYPPIVSQLIGGQNPDGSWQQETGNDRYFGNTHTTALAVLTLTTPYQVLPILQR